MELSQTELRMREGGTTTVSDEAITALAEVLRGRLVRPSDANYEDARSVWNGMVDRPPALIVQCAGVADVVHIGELRQGPRSARCGQRWWPQRCRKCGVRRRAGD